MPIYDVFVNFYVPEDDRLRVEANNPIDAEERAVEEIEKQYSGASDIVIERVREILD